MKKEKRKVVFLDNYDSFASTIAAYFELAGADVKMYKSDCDLDIICKEQPDMILLGPGPNSPLEAGNYLEAIDRFHKEYPIFGICLGFQAMMHYFGAEVEVMKQAVHGAPSAIRILNNDDIFEGINNYAEFARYHSLGVRSVPGCFYELAICSDSLENPSLSSYSGSLNIVMAAKHKELPIGGVQFHPESILSTGKGQGVRLVENVLKYLRKE